MIKYTELRNHMIHDSVEDLVEYCSNNITVREYLPLGRKSAIADVFAVYFSTILERMMGDKNTVLSEIMTEYEMQKMFDILFRYIDVPFDQLYMNYLEYDLIMQSGFFDYVMQFCERDYNTLSSLVDRVVGLNDMAILNLFNERFAGLDEQKVESMINMVENIDQTKIDKLMKIHEMNNPLVADIANTIRKTAVLDANTKQKDNIVDFPNK